MERLKTGAIVIGGSSGALDVLTLILPTLTPALAPPVIVVLHLPKYSHSGLCELFGGKCKVGVREAEDKLPIEPAVIYFAPPGYHLLTESELSFALSVDPPVHYSRPAIDVLFESASNAFGPRLVGILLSGANKDGAAGLGRIRAAGGTAIVQDPRTSQAAEMPRAGLEACPDARTMSPAEISSFLSRVSRTA